MKTETLIELQRGITQGEWRLNNCQRTGMALIEDSKGGDIAICDEGFPQHNARAIALVPELIAEVIRLREVLRACADQLDAETLGGEALDSARAALENDK